MIDKKIIDALVCCLQDDASLCCNECPIRETNICNEGTSEISTGLVNVVLDIINSQKAEIERLQRNLEEAHIDIREHKAVVDKYKNIKTTMVEFWDILLRLQIAKRKEKPTLEELAEALDELKAEAINEFAERLTEKATSYMNEGSVSVNDIDNLAKELTE